MQASLVPERILSPTLGEEVRTYRFPSGLRVFLCPKPGFKKRYACYSVFYGSVDSEFVTPSGKSVRVPDGIAHFLEHTLFETEEGNASELFSRQGAYSNAATSFTATTYLFATTGSFYESLGLLLRFVEHPVFHPDKVAKEVGIIEQEIQGYRDSPHWVAYMGLLEGLYERHPLRIDIAGSVDSIRRIDSATLHECYGAFYSPANMILCAVGDIDPDEFFSFVAARSVRAYAAPSAGGSVRRLYPDEPRRVFRADTRKAMKVALPKLLLGFKDVGTPERGDEYMIHDLASSLALELLFGRSSDLFQELYESGIILDDFGASYGLGAGVGHGVVGGETPEPDRLREVLLGRIASLLDSGISSSDFERTKRSMLGSFVRGFNSLEYIAGNYTHCQFHDFDLFHSVDLLAALDRSTVEGRVRALLDPSNHAAMVIVPD